MSVFATEIPVSAAIERGRFAAQAIAWVKGMPTSKLFARETGLEKFDGEATVSAPSGEKLTLRECLFEGGFSIGARHEIPDDEGRIWRSEVILTSRHERSALRARTQCILAKADARLQLPRKPYFLKMAIDDGWPTADETLQVRADPTILKIDDVQKSSEYVLGKFDTFLPVIYISRPGPGEKGLSQAKIEILAFRLGGVGHVLVEPSREFSRRLQAISGGKNPYGGAVGVCIPTIGVSRRFLMGQSLANEDALVQAVQDFAVGYVASRVPRYSWEWQDLLEESGRQLRVKANSTSSDIEAWDQLRAEENEEKDNIIRILRGQLSDFQRNAISQSASDRPSLLPPIIQDQLGPELYEDEFSDRLLYVLKSVLSTKIEVDGRTKQIIAKINSLVRFSGGASKLEERIKAAGRDSSRSNERLGEILIELGFSKRSQGGHPVFSPVNLNGVGVQTLSSSASDHRAGRNAAAQIIRDLAITRLRD